MVSQSRLDLKPGYVFTAAETFPEIDFPLVASVDDMPDHQVPEHSHEFSEIVVVRRGSGTYRFGNVDLPAAAGDVFVISPGERHALINCQEMVLTLFLFKRESLLDQQFTNLSSFIALFDLQPLLRPGPAQQRHLRLSADQLAEVIQIHQALARDLDGRRPAYRHLATARFHQVIAMCCQAYECSREEATAVVPRLAAVVSFINQHFAEPIRLAQLAAAAGCSVNQLGRLFNVAFAETPGQYIMRRRLELAAEQLRTTKHSVTTIAFDCGFSDGNYLSKQFKKHYQVSPRQWRDQSRVLNDH